jgi:hypothetical protein
MHDPRIGEFSALLTRIRALGEIRGVQARREIEAALAEADAWPEMSGAKSYERLLKLFPRTFSPSPSEPSRCQIGAKLRRTTSSPGLVRIVDLLVLEPDVGDISGLALSPRKLPPPPLRGRR